MMKFTNNLLKNKLEIINYQQRLKILNNKNPKLKVKNQSNSLKFLSNNQLKM